MKICLMGMDDRTRQSVSLVFKHRADGALVLANEDVADIAILDMDQTAAVDGYLAVRARRPELQAIGLSAKSDLAHDGVLIIRKPIAANKLLEAIHTLAQNGPLADKAGAAGVASFLSSRIGSSRRRPETAPVQAQERQTFDPDAYLLGSILNAAAEAQKREQVAIVSFYGDRVILVDGQSDMIETNLSSSQARAFALAVIGGDSAAAGSSTTGLQRPVIEFAPRAEAASRFEGKTYSVPREVFMWKLGAMTSRGRLPANTRADERVYLRRWPNMTRFSYSDNDMRIVAYWVRQACSQDEIVNALGVSAQEVFSVYTAALAAGIAGKASRGSDEIWEAPEVTEHKERGLFSSIMKRLLQRKPASTESEQELAA